MYPSQVESLILDSEEMGPHCGMRIIKKGYVNARVVEVEAEVYPLGKDKAAELKKRINSRLQQVMGIKVAVTHLKRGSIPGIEGKVRRVVGERGK